MELDKLIIDSCINVSALAKRMKVHRSTIHSWIFGYGKPGNEYLIKAELKKVALEILKDIA